MRPRSGRAGPPRSRAIGHVRAHAVRAVAGNRRRARTGRPEVPASQARPATPLAPGSPTLATSVAAGRCAPEPACERGLDRGRIGEHVRVVPLGAGQDGDLRPVRVEVAGVLVRLDDERRPRSWRAVAGGPPVTEVGSSAPTNAAGSCPAATSTCTSQPAVVLLPCVPATATSGRPAAASATTCCHGSTRDAERHARRQLRMVGVDRGQGLRDGQPVAAAARPSRAPDRGRRQAGCPAASSAGVYGDGPPASQPVTTAPGVVRKEGRSARPGPGGPDDVDPLRRGRDRAGRPAPARRPRRSVGGAASSLPPTAPVTDRAPVERSRAARAPLPRWRVCCRAVRIPHVAADDVARAVGHGDVGEPDGLLVASRRRARRCR